MEWARFATACPAARRGGALIGELPGIGFIRAVEHQRRKHLKAGVEQHTVLNGEQDVVDGAIDPAR